MFGTFYASIVCLEPVVVEDIVGVDHMARAYELYFAFQSIGIVLSSPISSLLYNLSGSYTASGLFMGAVLILSFLCFQYAIHVSC